MTSFHKKTKYIKLEKIAPATHDYNTVVKILEKKTLVDKIASNGKRVRYDEVLIGDETGCMALNVHGAQCEGLEVGKVVAIHNARVKVINKRLTLAFDKWSSVRSTTIAIPGEEQRDPNFSDHVYNEMVE